MTLVPSHCDLCNCFVGLQSTDVHVNGKRHQANLALQRQEDVNQRDRGGYQSRGHDMGRGRGVDRGRGRGADRGRGRGADRGRGRGVDRGRGRGVDRGRGRGADRGRGRGFDRGRGRGVDRGRGRGFDWGHDRDGDSSGGDPNLQMHHQGYEGNDGQPRRKRQRLEDLPRLMRNPPMLEEMPPDYMPQDMELYDMLQNSRDVMEQMDILVNTQQLSADEIAARHQFADEIQEIVRDCFEFSRVEIFGSTKNGLGVHGCDLDVSVSLLPDEVVRDQSKTYTVLTHAEYLDRLKGVAEGYLITVQEVMTFHMNTIGLMLKNYVSKHRRVENPIYIRSKRCPIIRFYHSGLGINCDISMTNRMAVHNTALTRLYAQLDRRAYLLFFTVRYWAKEHCLSGGGGSHFSNYAIVMLVVFFLQNTNPPVLPTVQELQSMASAESERVANGMDCTFCDELAEIPESRNTQSPDVLLKKFFNFYFNLDFGSFALCPRVGAVTPKMDLVTTNPELMVRDSYLCIQDPFNLTHNVTANLTDEVISNFIGALKTCAAVAKNEHVFSPDLGPRHFGLLAFSPSEESRGPRQHLVPPKMCSFQLYFPQSVMLDILTKSDRTLAERKYWCKKFRRILVQVFETVLRFECTEYETSDVPAETSARESRKRTADGRPVESIKYYHVDESGQRIGSERPMYGIEPERNKMDDLSGFVCTVHYNTLWKRKRQEIASESVMELEEAISKEIMAMPGSRVSPPMSFKCRVVDVEGHAGLIVSLLPQRDSPSCVNLVLASLKGYIPTFFTNYCDQLLKK